MSKVGSQVAVVKHYIEELWNKKNNAIQNDLCQYKPDPRGGIFRKSFPDCVLKIDQQFEHKDIVVTQYTVTGTHTRTYLGVKPTKKRVSFSATFMHRVVDGKIVERWGASDGLGVLQQIGGLPEQVAKARAAS